MLPFGEDIYKPGQSIGNNPGGVGVYFIVGEFYGSAATFDPLQLVGIDYFAILNIIHSKGSIEQSEEKEWSLSIIIGVAFNAKDKVGGVAVGSDTVIVPGKLFDDCFLNYRGNRTPAPVELRACNKNSSLGLHLI